MSFDFNTCRVCKESASSSDLVKYGVRHYAHPRCAMQKWGADFFGRITPWQATRFPYFAAAEFGHEKALAARCAEAA